MPVTCLLCGVHCGSSLHRSLLRDHSLLREWKEFLGKPEEWIPNMGTRLCCRHFEAEYVEQKGGKLCLHEKAIPTIKMVPVPVRLKNGKIRAIGPLPESLASEVQPSVLELLTTDANSVTISDRILNFNANELSAKLHDSEIKLHIIIFCFKLKLFDCLNSRHPLQTGRKSPLSKANKGIWAKTFRDAKDQLYGLCCTHSDTSDTDEKTLILDTDLYTGPLGLLIAIQSVEGLMDEFVCCENPRLKYLLTYKLIQDHLELFFSSIRSCLGNNNNPNVIQLKGSLRSVLSASIVPSLSGNCFPLDETELVCIRTARDSFVRPSDLVGVEEPVPTVEEPINPDFSYEALSQFTRCVTTYIAGNVVRNIRKTKVECEPCRVSLVTENPDDFCEEDHRLITLKQNGGLVHPSQAVLDICKTTETVIRELASKGLDNMNLNNIVKVSAQRCVDKLVFGQTRKIIVGCSDVLKNHSAPLMNMIIRLYGRIRLHHYTKIYTQNVMKSSVRSQNTRGTIFQGM